MCSAKPWLLQSVEWVEFMFHLEKGKERLNNVPEAKLKHQAVKWSPCIGLMWLVHSVLGLFHFVNRKCTLVNFFVLVLASISPRMSKESVVRPSGGQMMIFCL